MFTAVHCVCHSRKAMINFSNLVSQRMARRILFIWITVLCATTLLQAQQTPNHLANSTVLVIRHAEKPAAGASLNSDGVARADKYARYFNPFVVDGATIRINALYAGSDSSDSMRPRLTLEPLSHATGIPLNLNFSTNDPDAFAHGLAAEQHGNHVLVAWRHKKIPALLKVLGADPTLLLPGGAWPDAVYDWVILLHFDAAGRVDQQRLIHEPDPLP
jgi:hypothetical protein